MFEDDVLSIKSGPSHEETIFHCFKPTWWHVVGLKQQCWTLFCMATREIQGHFKLGGMLLWSWRVEHKSVRKALLFHFCSCCCGIHASTNLTCHWFVSGPASSIYVHILREGLQDSDQWRDEGANEKGPTTWYSIVIQGDPIEKVFRS